jgi:hypothetical protein
MQLDELGIMGKLAFYALNRCDETLCESTVLLEPSACVLQGLKAS